MGSQGLPRWEVFRQTCWGFMIWEATSGSGARTSMIPAKRVACCAAPHGTATPRRFCVRPAVTTIFPDVGIATSGFVAFWRALHPTHKVLRRPHQRHRQLPAPEPARPMRVAGTSPDRCRRVTGVRIEGAVRHEWRVARRGGIPGPRAGVQRASESICSDVRNQRFRSAAWPMRVFLLRRTRDL